MEILKSHRDDHSYRAKLISKLLIMKKFHFKVTANQIVNSLCAQWVILIYLWKYRYKASCHLNMLFPKKSHDPYSIIYFYTATKMQTSGNHSCLKKCNYCCSLE